MNIKNKIELLRSKMIKYGIDAYIILGTDPHMSEYIPNYWKARQWISGFTGSYGNIVVTKDKAGLWTDSRYFIQAEQQLKDTSIDLYKLRTEGYLDYPEWLEQELEKGNKIGIDGFSCGISDYKRLKTIFTDKNIEIVTSIDLVSTIWTDERPSLPMGHSFNYSIKYSGVSRIEKLEAIRSEMKKQNVDYHLIASLDDVAWCLNVRGNDVAFNPIVISYLLISHNDAIWFVHKEKIPKELESQLESENIKIEEYSDIIKNLEKIKNKKTFLIDPNKLNVRLFNIIKNIHNTVEAENPSVLMKSIKNSTEIDGMKNAALKDGVALTKFFYWLENSIDETQTEISLAEKLRSFREEQDGFIDESFNPIVAYKENAALPHYSATKEKCSKIKAEGLLLIDSGGQYIDGTTDITRTTPLGKLTQEEKDDYTLVLKGTIGLSLAKFPKGTKGCNLDILARQALWNAGLNYGHGTGHGVGCLLNVHEGPQSIRQEIKDQAVEEGMITSNEPGVYKEGRHGIRHENLVLCVKDKETEFGTFLKFETLTKFYFDTSGLNIDLLTINEINWLNNYNNDVYNTLSPLLDKKYCEWLKEKTKLI